ncbi:hypothetical protein J4210_05695 [Candidatus Woesearchaeota archaeon]|nr:hypothetical protein [Candidatus Woesearchaeota archaeon]
MSRHLKDEATIADLNHDVAGIQKRACIFESLLPCTYRPRGSVADVTSPKM